jgi:hypothetical protein
MKKYLVAAVLLAGFAGPAFAAEQFYVAFDGKRCEVFNHKPAGMNVLGSFKSQHDARKGMQKFKQCEKG